VPLLLEEGEESLAKLRALPHGEILGGPGGTGLVAGLPTGAVRQ
jgi:hypothetical protein